MSRAIEREPRNFRYVELHINVLVKREQFEAAFEQLAHTEVGPTWNPWQSAFFRLLDGLRLPLRC